MIGIHTGRYSLSEEYNKTLINTVGWYVNKGRLSLQTRLLWYIKAKAFIDDDTDIIVVVKQNNKIYQGFVLFHELCHYFNAMLFRHRVCPRLIHEFIDSNIIDKYL